LFIAPPHRLAEKPNIVSMTIIEVFDDQIRTGQIDQTQAFYGIKVVHIDDDAMIIRAVAQPHMGISEEVFSADIDALAVAEPIRSNPE
jgi:hypothetical protein